MTSPNCYDVTDWPVGDPSEDIGEVINSILDDVMARQPRPEHLDQGRPGAVIHIPPGDYRLRTQVRIDISFLRIEGSGHGFTSSSIRYNVPDQEVPDLHELWPGGSRIIVDLPTSPGTDERDGAAFLVERSGNPRISSVEFANFCIDGQHFMADGSGLAPENSYRNGRTGIHVACANDSFRVTEMGFVYLEHALTIQHADALSIHDNFIAECGNCIELRGWGQASKITDNLIGAGPRGHSIHAENHGGLLIAANNVFPRGASSIHLDGVTRSNVANNRLHSFYPGSVVLTSGSSENLVTGNHILRDEEPWTPFQGVDNSLTDDFGVLRIEGRHNSVIGNHFSLVLDGTDRTPVAIRVAGGSANHVASNSVVALRTPATGNNSAYAAQVDALLRTEQTEPIPVTAVLVDPASTHNTLLDTGRESEIDADRTCNAVRPTPEIPAP